MLFFPRKRRRDESHDEPSSKLQAGAPTTTADDTPPEKPAVAPAAVAGHAAAAEPGPMEPTAGAASPHPDVACMLLDIVESGEQGFNEAMLWCVDAAGATVLLRVRDFHNYFFFPAPEVVAAAAFSAGSDGGRAEGSDEGGEDRGGGDKAAAGGGGEGRFAALAALSRIRQDLNRRLQPYFGADAVAAVTVEMRRPLMFYRPAPLPFLRVTLCQRLPSGLVKQTVHHIQALARDGIASGDSGSTADGGVTGWAPADVGTNGGGLPVYEEDVGFLTRFMADTNVSGGSWLTAPAAALSPVPAGECISDAATEAYIGWRDIRGRAPNILDGGSGGSGGESGGSGESGKNGGEVAGCGTGGGVGGEWMAIAPLSSLSVVVTAVPQDCMALRAEVDPIVQIAHWLIRPEPRPVASSAVDAAAAAGAAATAALAVAGLAVAGQLEEGELDLSKEAGEVDDGGGGGESDGSGGGGGSSGGDSGGENEETEDTTTAMLLEKKGAAGAGGAAVVPSADDGGAGSQGRGRAVVFTTRRCHCVWDDGENDSTASADAAATAVAGEGRRGRLMSPSGPVEVRWFPTERSMLLAWRDWLVVEADPDLIVGWDVVGFSLRYASARFKQLRLSGGRLCLSRRRRGGDDAQGIRIKDVQNYGKDWVKRQQRMSATSNQKSFQLERCGGRLVVDVLRAAVTGHTMTRFTLDEAASVFLDFPREALTSSAVTYLARVAAGSGNVEGNDNGGGGNGKGGRGGSGSGTSNGDGGRISGGNVDGGSAGGAASDDGGGGGSRGSGGRAARGCSEAEAAAERLVLWGVAEALLPQRLAARLRIFQEALELARVTGLPVTDVVYRAQMARTFSLLLRVAARHGFLVGGPPESRGLAPDTTTFLHHPVVNKTRGFYGEGTPVAVLDFASLYPSIYCGYNLCYSTLVHPSDMQSVESEGYKLNASPASQYLASDYFIRSDVGGGSGNSGSRSRSAGGGCGGDGGDGGSSGTGGGDGGETGGVGSSGDAGAGGDGSGAAGGGNGACDDGGGSNSAGADGKAMDVSAHGDGSDIGAGTGVSEGGGGSSAAPVKRGPRGLFPKLLEGLLRQRAAAKARLKAEKDPVMLTVLDCRQRALKTCANAAYGFTGSTASPQPCTALAESCLRYGVFLCRTAKAEIEGPFAAAVGISVRVVYGQTDSLMMEVPGATVAQAVELGRAAAEHVTRTIDRPPIKLAFERVLSPFLLDITNFYAGVAFDSPPTAPLPPPPPLPPKPAAASAAASSSPGAANSSAGTASNGVSGVRGGSSAGVSGGSGAARGASGSGPWTEAESAAAQRMLAAGGRCLIRGFASQRRGEAGVVRRCIRGCLERLLLWRDPAAAMVYARGDVVRLLSGGCALDELTVSSAIWRDDGQDIAAGAGEPTKTSDTPHVALAKRLQARDPNRIFLLGERIPYVFIAGGRTQSDKAEDPLVALETGAQPDLMLYWNNKLKGRLHRIFRFVLPDVQLHDLLQGAHTKVRPTSLSGMAPAPFPLLLPPVALGGTGGVTSAGTGDGGDDTRSCGARSGGSPAEKPAAATGKTAGIGAFLTERKSWSCLLCRSRMTSDRPVCEACRREGGGQQAAVVVCMNELARAEAAYAAAAASRQRTVVGGSHWPAFGTNYAAVLAQAWQRLRDVRAAIERLDKAATGAYDSGGGSGGEGSSGGGGSNWGPTGKSPKRAAGSRAAAEASNGGGGSQRSRSSSSRQGTGGGGGGGSKSSGGGFRRHGGQEAAATAVTTGQLPESIARSYMAAAAAPCGREAAVVAAACGGRSDDDDGGGGGGGSAGWGGNRESSGRGAACGGGGGASRSRSRPWACRLCTFENFKPYAAICEMCSTAR